MNYTDNPRLIQNYGKLIQEVESAHKQVCYASVNYDVAGDEAAGKRRLAAESAASLSTLLRVLTTASDDYDKWAHRNVFSGKGTK